MIKSSLWLLTCLFLFAGCQQLSLNHQRPDFEFFVNTWSKDLGWMLNQKRSLNIAFQSPVMAQGKVFQGTAHGRFYVFNDQTGKLLWDAQEDSALSSAVVKDQRVFYGTAEGQLIARDHTNGKLIYSVFVGGPIETAPVVDETQVVVGLRNHAVVAIERSKGEFLWSYKRSISYSPTSQGHSPLRLEKKRILAGFADGFVVALNRQDGSVLWESKISKGNKFVDVDAALLIRGQTLYAVSGDGQIALLDLQRGRLLKRLPFPVYRAPLLGQGEETMFLASQNEELVQVDASGKVLQRLKLNFLPTALTWWQGKILLGGNRGKVLLVSPEDLSIISSFSFGGKKSALYGDFAFDEQGRMAFLSSQHHLYTFSR